MRPEMMVLLVAVAACNPLPESGTEDAATLRVGGVLGEGSADPGFARAREPAHFDFPTDHGPHPQFRSEWWYFTAVLDDAAGNAYGVQFTVFRQALAPHAESDNPWQTNQIYLGHLALTDVARATHREDQRLARGHPRLAGARADPFAVWVDDWSLASDAASLLPARLRATAQGFAVDLILEAEGAKPLTLEGRAGFSPKGEDQASYYYSMPRIRVVGTLRPRDDEAVQVEGLGWIDREWSTSVLGASLVGWEWFGLHLDSGADLMLFRLRRADGRADPNDAGTWIEADGASVALDVDDFTLTPTRHWRDSKGRSWPVGWRLECRFCGSGLTVEAALDDQRMDLALVYWEGLVYVMNADGQPAGRGYMELTGY